MYLVEIGVKKNIGLNRPHNSYETLALKKIWRLVVVCFVFENNAEPERPINYVCHANFPAQVPTYQLAVRRKSRTYTPAIHRKPPNARHHTGENAHGTPAFTSDPRPAK